MTEEPQYKVERKKPGMTKRAKVGFVGLLGAASVVALYTVMTAGADAPVLQTSDAKEFEQPQAGSGFGVIEPGKAAADDIAVEVFGNLEKDLAAQRASLESQNSDLQGEVTRLQTELAGLAESAADQQDTLAKELATALDKAQVQNLALLENVRGEFGMQVEALRAENASLQANLAADRTAASAEANVEADRRARLEARRSEQEALMKTRIASPGVVFDDGQTSGGDGVASDMGSASASRDATGRDFVQAGLDPVDVSQAQVIANPANTVLQGTMIEATLENAVDSSLPGQLAATVTHPVWSFDQSQILIPAGSRLFGNYSSDVSIGQGRILVGWTRIVTPDGQSVQMEAFGGDAQGRSGITGKVNSRFGMRFGSAALISLLGAAPAIAAAKVSDATTSDTAQNVADDLSGATSTAIDAYINLPPIISVAPGAAITVMVDRDLEIY